MKFEYFDNVQQILDSVILEENDAMTQAVEVMVNAIKNRNSLYCFGASHAGIITQELYYRAGGLAVINPIFAREIMLDTEPITHTSRMERLIGYGSELSKCISFEQGDVLILHSVSGRNPVVIELALEAKKQGVKTIGLTNISYTMDTESRHPSGLRLCEVCDVVIDNHGEKGDACVQIEGLKQKVAPSSTVIGAAIMNSIVAAVAESLAAQGINPPVYFSANIDGGDSYNEQMIKSYGDQIHYRF